MLTMYLFGRLQVFRCGRCLNRFPTRKTQELFCYLVLNRQRPHSRDALAGILWADSPQEQARQCLRTTLWRLRSYIGLDKDGSLPCLDIHNDEIRFNTQVDYWLDVEQFEHALFASQPLTADDGGVCLAAEPLQRLIRAVELYRGDLLEDCYEDWCLYERERLQGLFLGALARLMAHYRDQRAYEAAIRYGQRILSYDPLLEGVHRDLMRLYWLAGNRGAAARQYHLCHAILDKELGIEPMDETIALYRQICQPHESQSDRRALLARDSSDRRVDPKLPSIGMAEECSPLASQVDRALRQLHVAQAEVQQLSSHFQSGMETLEAIKKHLGYPDAPRG